MKFKLEISCDNAAFADDLYGEVASILNRAAGAVHNQITADANQRYNLHDTNGNRVGFMTFIEE